MSWEIMWRKHDIFPEVPRGFWRRFRKRWAEPLQILEEMISLSESLANNRASPKFDAQDETYWLVMFGLHSRTCLHARAVLALLANGLVAPALGQWRTCHELATIALFIAQKPEMAARYKRHAVVNKYHLAKELDDIDHEEGLSETKFKALEEDESTILQCLNELYKRKYQPRDNYAWSGLGGFRGIEKEVYKDRKWKPRPEYIDASNYVHAASSAGAPLDVSAQSSVFLVGPTDSGLTDPVDRTSFSIWIAAEALVMNASLSSKDEEIVVDLFETFSIAGTLCWIRDPAIICQDCGGYRDGASPPGVIQIEERLEPCGCRFSACGGTGPQG